MTRELCLLDCIVGRQLGERCNSKIHTLQKRCKKIPGAPARANDKFSMQWLEKLDGYTPLARIFDLAAR